MAVRFFRLTIKGSDEDKLNSIKNWFDTKIEFNDLDDKLGWSTNVSDEDIDSGIFIFNCDMYIKLGIGMNKYKDILRDKFQAWDKTGLISAKIIQYDSCSHDEEVHLPCQPTIRMEWNA